MSSLVNPNFPLPEEANTAWSTIYGLAPNEIEDRGWGGLFSAAKSKLVV
jgi:hypothetical protein